MPEFCQLRYFLEVAAQRSFSRAARTMHLSQSAISQQIGTLEREYHCRLFVRGRNGAELTAAGIVLVQHAERVLAAMGEADTAMQAAGSPVNQHLRVGSAVGPLLHLLPAALVTCVGRHPGLTFAVSQGSTATICTRVHAGSLDLGIASMPLPPVPIGLSVRPLYDDPLKVIMADNHPLGGHHRVPVQATRGLPFVALPKGHPARDAFVAACQHLGFTPDIVLETDHGELIREFVARGLAISVVPGLMMRNADHGRIAVRPLTSPRLVRRAVIVTRTNQAPNAVASELIELLTGSAGQSVANT